MIAQKSPESKKNNFAKQDFLLISHKIDYLRRTVCDGSEGKCRTFTSGTGKPRGKHVCVPRLFMRLFIYKTVDKKEEIIYNVREKIGLWGQNDFSQTLKYPKSIIQTRKSKKINSEVKR